MKEQPQTLPHIPEHRRHLYFRLIDNYQDFHFITLRLYFLNDHFPPDYLDRALTWLIQNNFTGREFLLWFKHVCQNSDLEMQRRLLNVVAKTGPVPLIAGKNFRL